jgi:tRNA pseudouridine55 synthase
MGQVIESSEIIPREKDINKALESFIGESMQVAPFFSALKFKGKPLYKYAREGEFISKPPRYINIFSIKDINHEANYCSLSIHCSKGTYIRSIARDLGDKLGCGAHLSSLIRTSQGSFSYLEAKKPELINIDQLISIESAFNNFSDINLDHDQTKNFSNGVKILDINHENNHYKIYDYSSKFLGLGIVSESVLALKRLV